MVVAKRQGRENRTKEGPRTGVRTQLEHTALLASPVNMGQAQGEDKTSKKRSQRAGGLCLPHVLACSPTLFSTHLCVSRPPRLKDGFSCYFLNKIEL